MKNTKLYLSLAAIFLIIVLSIIKDPVDIDKKTENVEQKYENKVLNYKGYSVHESGKNNYYISYNYSEIIDIELYHKSRKTNKSAESILADITGKAVDEIESKEKKIFTFMGPNIGEINGKLTTLGYFVMPIQ